jgi:hypothetical protein
MRAMSQSKLKWSRSVLGGEDELGEEEIVILEDLARVGRMNGMKAKM